jgi:Spy/CpxP family protein refolding chaperone
MLNRIARNFALTTRGNLLILACAAGFAAAPAIAQDPAPQAPSQQGQGGWQGHGRGGDQVERLTKALNLTPDQVAQIKTIQANTRQQMEALRADTSIAQSDKRAKMMSIHQTEQTSIKAVLTDDQKAEYEAMQAQMRQRREQHQDGEQGQPPPPPGL